jgi:hypothetical protein
MITRQEFVCNGKNMETEINLSECAAGIYFLLIESKNGSRVLKVVKE